MHVDTGVAIGTRSASPHVADTPFNVSMDALIPALFFFVAGALGGYWIGRRDRRRNDPL